jgi:hypothetical protein
MNEIVASMSAEHRALPIDDIPMPFDCRFADIDVRSSDGSSIARSPDCPIVDEKRS